MSPSQARRWLQRSDAEMEAKLASMSKAERQRYMQSQEYLDSTLEYELIWWITHECRKPSTHARKCSVCARQAKLIQTLRKMGARMPDEVTDDQLRGRFE